MSWRRIEMVSMAVCIRLALASFEWSSEWVNVTNCRTGRFDRILLTLRVSGPIPVLCTY